MNLMTLFASIGVIGSADGPTTTVVTGLPLPALTVAVFAVAFIAYVYIAKAINAKKAPEQPVNAVTAAAPSVAPAAPAVPVYTGPVLTGVEEKEAAVIMAIVSNKTGIPLEKLKFESIKLLEDK